MGPGPGAAAQWKAGYYNYILLESCAFPTYLRPRDNGTQIKVLWEGIAGNLEPGKRCLGDEDIKGEFVDVEDASA